MPMMIIIDVTDYTFLYNFVKLVVMVMHNIGYSKGILAVE